MNRGSCPDDSADLAALSGGRSQIVSPSVFADHFAETVRIFCKVRRLKTIRQLAEDAGIAEKRMQKLIDNDPLERRHATASEMLSIWAALGTAAASRDLRLIGMQASEDEAEAGPGIKLGMVVAEMFGAGSEIARIAADGKVDRSEALQTEQACDRLEGQLNVLRAAAKAARQ